MLLRSAVWRLVRVLVRRPRVLPVVTVTPKRASSKRDNKEIDVERIAAVVDIFSIANGAEFGRSHPATASPAVPQSARQPEARSIPAIREQLGTLLTPRFVPNGFELKSSAAMGSNALVRYEGPVHEVHEEGNTYRGPVSLEIRQLRGIRRGVLAGAARPIIVGGRPGHVIHGAWLRDHHTGVFDWKTILETSVVFEHSGFAIVIATMPGNAIEDDVLIHIAESLEA